MKNSQYNSQIDIYVWKKLKDFIKLKWCMTSGTPCIYTFIYREIARVNPSLLQSTQ